MQTPHAVRSVSDMKRYSDTEEEFNGLEPRYTLMSKKRKLNDVNESNAELYQDDSAAGLANSLGVHLVKLLSLVTEWECPISKTKLVYVAAVMPLVLEKEVRISKLRIEAMLSN